MKRWILVGTLLLLALSSPTPAARLFVGSQANNLISWPVPWVATCTECVWVKPTSNVGSTPAVTCFWNASAVYDQCITLSATPKAVAYTYDTGQKFATGTTTLSNGTWYFLCARFASGSSMEIFVNGTQEATTAIGTPYTVTSSVFHVSGTSLSSTWLDATVANVMVWNVALTANEIKMAMTGRSVRPSALILAAPLWATSTTEADLSGLKYNGTVTGTSLADHAPVGPYVLR